jgi:hypothetical protein
VEQACRSGRSTGRDAQYARLHLASSREAGPANRQTRNHFGAVIRESRSGVAARLPEHERDQVGYGFLVRSAVTLAMVA